MDSSEEQVHFIKRVVLPSGKIIEVVYFKDADRSGAVPRSGAAAAAGDTPRVVGSDQSGAVAKPVRDLHVCPECESGLVQPAEWEESGPHDWLVTLSCPNCGTSREGVFSQETVEAFDEELDRGADTLARDYRSLARANMAEEIDRFVAALTADALLPMDF